MNPRVTGKEYATAAPIAVPFDEEPLYVPHKKVYPQRVVGRFPDGALLFFLYRNLAAGSLLLHRTARSRSVCPFPDERRRRPGLVWLSLPADRLGRSLSF